VDEKLTAFLEVESAIKALEAAAYQPLDQGRLKAG
jgi:hypothetical protein